MTELLLKLFIRNYDRADNAVVHAATGKLAGIVGIACNALLFLGKLITGLLTGSVSIVADAMNNLSDASSSAITFWGFRMAQRPADAHHPYGHARYEYVSGFVVATLILVIGVELGKSSIERILHPSPMIFSAVAIGVLLASIALKIWMSFFFRSLGRRIRSTTLLATAADSRNDVLASSVVLVGALVNRCFGVNVDGWMGLAVALFILHSGFSIARETISPLLGRQADRELLDGISALILRHRGVLGIHDLLVHDYGPGRYFASVHVELSAGEAPQLCHEIIDDIECDALRELNVNLVIHYDPVETGDMQLNELRDIVEEIVREIDPALSIHDFRILRSSKRGKLVFDLEVPYSMALSHGEIKERIDEALWKRGKPYRTVIRFDGKE